tara:strand:+ start:286 stop:1356 length:1071 start_codon:yes stop_codon:yes gene_type:complete
MQDTIALKLRNIRHVYGDTVAVDDFNIDVHTGEVVCLLGPSGCGKTTALRVAAGLETLKQGEVSVDGAVVADSRRAVPPEQRGVGLVFQDYALFPHLTIIQNVEFGLSNLSVGEKNIRAVTVLEQVGMNWATARYPHTLSGGQQQRVALARAIAPRPPVILLDEPFSGLDARLRDQVRDESLHILKESGTAALLVTHDPEEAMFMADRIGVMRDGRLVQFDKPDELYMRPTDAFVAEFFGEVNKVYGTAANGIVNTPIGDFPAPTFADGQKAEIIIRPEAINVGAERADTALCGKVLASRMLGRTSLIHLCLRKHAKQEFHLHSRIPGRHLPAENETVSIEFDPSRAFVFPAMEAD